ncbi:MAG: hypothetical protein ACOYN4_11215 [Bacteroidales bacterium]
MSDTETPQLSQKVLDTLDYFQEIDNNNLKKSTELLHKILVLLCLPVNENLPQNNEKLELVEDLSLFISMIDGLKAT